jgi:hypothetical protein
MKVFTELGMDTGFKKGQPLHHTEGQRYEWPVRGTRTQHPIPYIIKEPKMCTDLDLRIKANGWQIDHIYILTRSPGPAAPAKAFIEKGHPRGSAPIDERKMLKVTRWFTRRYIQLIHAAAELSCPVTLVSYPKFAEDPDYAYDKFKYLIKTHAGAYRGEFIEKLREFADPEEIVYARESAPERDMTYMRECVS